MRFYEPKNDADAEQNVSRPPAASESEPAREAADSFGAYVIEHSSEPKTADKPARPKESEPERLSASEDAHPPKRRKFALREFKPLPYLFPLIMGGGTFIIMGLMEESELETKSVNPSGAALRNAPPPKLDLMGDTKPLEMTDVKRLFAFQQPPAPPRDAPSAPLNMARAQPPPPPLPMSPAPPSAPPFVSEPAHKGTTPPVTPRAGRSSQRSTGVAAIPQTVRRPIYARPGGTIKVLPESNEAQLLEVGQRFKATLDVGVSSTHARKVLARVKSDVQNGQRVALKAGDMLEGSVSYDHARIYLTFTQVKTGGRKRAMAGEAISDDMPGLNAGGPNDTDNRARTSTVRTTLNTVQDAAQAGISALASATLPGQIVGRVVSSVARDTVAQAQREHRATGQPAAALQLPAGTEFEIVITGD